MLEDVYQFEVNAAGQSIGFLLWQGIVEDIFDPLKMGRVRVRIVGVHNLDRIKMPTQTLPWATVIKSPIGSNQSPNLQLGDWVTGYFLDGIDAQKPTVIGKYDGIRSDRIDDFYKLELKSGTDLFFSSAPLPILTDEQKKMLRSYPKPDSRVRFTDRPTLPLLSQSIVEGTAVDIANKKRVHVCDISGAMRATAAAARAAFGLLMKGIRAAVKAILKILGFSPDSESTRFIELAKKIKRGIEYIQKFIDEINDISAVIIFYTRQVRAMIDWILSLPKSLAALLAECLNELLNSASAGFSSLIGDIVGSQTIELSKTFVEIIDSSKKLINDTTNLLTVPGQIVDALATPSTPTTRDQTINTILTFTSSFSTSNNSTSGISRP
jgi:hypothetical protein